MYLNKIFKLDSFGSNTYKTHLQSKISMASLGNVMFKPPQTLRHTCTHLPITPLPLWHVSLCHNKKFHNTTLHFFLDLS